MKRKLNLKYKYSLPKSIFLAKSRSVAIRDSPPRWLESLFGAAQHIPSPHRPHPTEHSSMVARTTVGNAVYLNPGMLQFGKSMIAGMTWY